MTGMGGAVTDTTKFIVFCNYEVFIFADVEGELILVYQGVRSGGPDGIRIVA